MRIAFLSVLILAACTGNAPATDVVVSQPAAQQGMTGYGTTSHVRAYAASVSEGDATAVIKVTLSPRTARQVTVDYITVDGSAREGTDYQRAKGSVTFKPGVTEQSIEIVLLDDDIAEAEESFVLRLYVADFAQLDTESVALTIVDDD